MRQIWPNLLEMVKCITAVSHHCPHTVYKLMICAQTNLRTGISWKKNLPEEVFNLCQNFTENSTALEFSVLG